MRKITFDIETKNTFADVESNEVTDLDLSLIAIHDSKSDEYTSYLEEDLPKLWPIIESADVLIGYNSDHFDIPLLNKYYPGDLTKIKSLDILREIKEQFGRRMKLDQVAEGTLGTKKSGHGLQAITWWNEGDIESIRKYCIDDVKITKGVYDFALGNKKLFFAEGGKKIEIPLNTDSWELLDDDHTMTHSLPF